MGELAKVADNKVTSAVATPAHLLQTAVEQGADIDKLEKLMNLQERYESEQARKAFAEALAGFQSELGPIIKRKQGHNCKYADLDDIAQEIRPILDTHGLAYSFSQDQDNTGIYVTCTVRHKSGHSESNRMGAPFDSSGGKNNIQAIASSVTYLRRYTLTGALGITTGEDDTDGGQPKYNADELIKYLDIVRDEFPTLAALKESLAIGDFSVAKEAWSELDEATQRQLWRAPSKGSALSTDERTKMKSNEWSAA